MFCVALTGTIASGKSTAAHFFAQQGITVISADNIAKQITAKGGPILKEITNHFGEDILLSSGELNRKALRDIIFNHQKERKWLEGLLHPRIRQEIKKEVSNVECPYCIIEIPLLFDRADYPYIDRVLYVKTNEKQQIERIKKRDSTSIEEAQKILNTQASEERYIAQADDILINEGGVENLKNQVLKLHNKYLTLAKSTRRID